MPNPCRIHNVCCHENNVRGEIYENGFSCIFTIFPIRASYSREVIGILHADNFKPSRNNARDLERASGTFMLCSTVRDNYIYCSTHLTLHIFLNTSRSLKLAPISVREIPPLGHDQTPLGRYETHLTMVSIVILYFI